MPTEDRTDETQRLLGAFSSPIRREILWRVWDRELSAGDIAKAFDLTAPTISQHLSVLRQAGLVTMRVDGTFRRYSARKDAVNRLRRVVPGDAGKWRASGGTPADDLASARSVGVVIAEVDAPCDQPTAYRAFTDGALYSRWAGVPVSLVDGQFAAEMEWGLRVRGTYDYLVEPALVVMTWDFQLDDVPVPGEGLRAYLEITSRDDGCHLVIHQLIRDPSQAGFMQRAWGTMLGRFRDHVRDAVNPAVEIAMRPKRHAGPPDRAPAKPQASVRKSLPGKVPRPRRS